MTVRQHTGGVAVLAAGLAAGGALIFGPSATAHAAPDLDRHAESRRLFAIGVGDFRLQRRALVFQRTGLRRRAAQGLAQAVGLGLGGCGAGAQCSDHHHQDKECDAHGQNFALRSTCRTSTA